MFNVLFTCLTLPMFDYIFSVDFFFSQYLAKISLVEICVFFFVYSPCVLPIGVWHCLVFTVPLSILRQQLKILSLPILIWIFPALLVTPLVPLAVLHQTHSSMCMLVLLAGLMHSPSSRPLLLQEYLDTCSIVYSF